MLKITVITSPGCRPCDATKRRLTKRGVSFDVRDVSTDPEALALARDLGHAATPVVVVRDERGEQAPIVDHWSGFDPSRLDRYAPRSPS